jgi:carbonic anhydrase
MYSSPYKSVKEDVEHLRGMPFIRKETTVQGFVFDVKTGLLNPVPVN